MYRLMPEVAGEIGMNSKIIYEKGIIKDIVYLHYEFSGWLGDELLTQTPCFIVSEALANSMSKSKLTGYKFEKMEISISDEFKQFNSTQILPNFVRLVPLGKVVVENNIVEEWSGDDICYEEEIELVVSKEAMEVIKKHKINNCDIDELIIV